MRQYKLLRKQLKRDIRLVPESFLSNKLCNIVDVSKKWALLNKMGVVGKKSSSPLEVFTANDLNLHYSSVTTVHLLCTIDELIAILKCR